MEDKETGPIHLRRIDRSRNMRRFYTLAIHPTLFGGASVIRNWGRAARRVEMETFDEPNAAVGAFEHLIRSEKRRGYRNPDANGSG